MSETKLISPLLDGFSMGNPMSEHNGVRCCPAIKDNTDKKYIVKIISVPATQAQLDALLLAGAYKDPADAMDYFRQVGEGILKEAELLKTLSKLEGFLPYEGWQMEPITRRRLGYEIYLVGSYKRSLEKHLKKHSVTHLEAINLGLDLCSALSICRQAGALYVDLKPSNIFVSEKKEYRIGDLGFVEMDALSYTALPDKYHSAYTPPELFDPMGSLNLTVDTYAVGMILYQLYNDGQLPFKGNRNPEETLPTPVNADYELAEIIMKAIHADPAERWNDPKDLGKALASYMQRNSINDVPITPHTPLDVKPEDIVVLPKKKKAAAKAETEETPAEIQEESSEPEVSPKTEPASEEDITAEEVTTDEAVAVDEAPVEVVEETTAPQEEISEELSDAPKESDTESVQVQEEESSEVISDEEDPNTIQPHEMSEELSQIVAKADDLIAHEMPEGVVVPELPVAPDPFAFIAEDSDEIDDSDVPEDPVMEDEEDSKSKKEKKKKKKEKKYQDPKYKRRTKRFFSTLLFLLLVGAASVCGYWYYQNMYLQPIDDISIEGTQDQLTVSVRSDVEESLLSVTCSDNYGNVKTSALSGGKAVFTDLLPNTLYTVQVEIDGFHALVGKTSDMFTTDATTKIVSFTSVAGSEDGSVVLNFTVDGDEPSNWTMFYSAEGQEEKRKTFTGHSVTIGGLSVGSVYTFRLEAGEGIALGGQTELELMATRLILAENLTISSDTGTEITVRWDAPGDVIVDSWNVRCYSNYNFEEEFTVTDTEVVIPNIDPIHTYTVEVTAAGMTQPARTSITEHPMIINGIKVDGSSHDKLKVTWDHTGEISDDGWLVVYSYVGGQKSVVKSEKASAVIPLNIPGSNYNISIQAADGTTVFNNTTVYQAPEAEPFDKHSLKAEKLSVDLVKTPDEDTWFFENLGSDAIQTSFVSGEDVSIVMRSSESFYLTGAEVNILFVIRDTYGNVLPDYVKEESVHWKDIWSGGDAKIGELDLPAVPTAAGEYVLDLYFDGMSVAQLNFTITQ